MAPFTRLTFSPIVLPASATAPRRRQYQSAEPAPRCLGLGFHSIQPGGNVDSARTPFVQPGGWYSGIGGSSGSRAPSPESRAVGSAGNSTSALLARAAGSGPDCCLRNSARSAPSAEISPPAQRAMKKASRAWISSGWIAVTSPESRVPSPEPRGASSDTRGDTHTSHTTA